MYKSILIGGGDINIISITSPHVCVCFKTSTYIITSFCSQGLGASEKKNYIIQQGEELTCLHFLSGRVKLIVTSERLNICKKCFHQSKAK